MVRDIGPPRSVGSQVDYVVQSQSEHEMTGLSSPIVGILGTMGATPTTDRGRLTRQRIVAAATDVVAEKGALGASLDEVGARAAASRSQIYHYFDDKDDLLLAVADATNDTVLDGQRDLFDHLDTWDGLVQWADALVALQQERGGRGGCPIANLLGQLGERDDGIRAVI